METPTTPSLRFKVEWIDAPWLLLITLEGVPTLPDYQRFSDERLRYLEGSKGYLYCICDWSRVEERLTPEIFAAMAKSAGHRHPNSGAIVSVGNQTLLKMVTTVIVQKAKPDVGRSTTSNVFPSLEDAVTFCREVAAVDPDKATGSALLAPKNETSEIPTRHD